MRSFRLSRAQRQRLLESDYRPLTFQVKPFGCEPGSVYVLNWQKELRSTTEDGHVIVVPKHPLRWLTVRTVQKRPEGWLVRFDVTDRRHPVRLLRALPPVMTPSPDLSAESSTSSEESFYTSSRFGAIDDLEVVPKDWLERVSEAQSRTDDEFRRRRAEDALKARSRARRRRAA